MKRHNLDCKICAIGGGVSAAMSCEARRDAGGDASERVYTSVSSWRAGDFRQRSTKIGDDRDDLNGNRASMCAGN